MKTPKRRLPKRLKRVAIISLAIGAIACFVLLVIGLREVGVIVLTVDVAMTLGWLTIAPSRINLEDDIQRRIKMVERYYAGKWPSPDNPNSKE